MTDLVEFLLARVDEDEQSAWAAGEGRIAWLTYLTDDGQMHHTTVAAGDDTAAGVDDVWVADGKELPTPARVHVVYDQARALREVEAKRGILEWAEHTAELNQKHDSYTFKGGVDAYDKVLRRLVLPYANHPDYDERWRP